MKSLNAIFFILLFITACKTNQPAADRKEEKANSRTDASTTVETSNQTLSLLDYLRKVPGVQITGPNNDPDIRVRMSVTLNIGETNPLFVIDNNPVGNNYSTVASLVDVNDIKSITVLKDVSSTSFYGIQGANGVIVIHLKKGVDN